MGIKYLGDSSNAKALENLIQEKLLSLSPKVQENFVGLTHDHASSLSGHVNGLGELLKKILPNPFMDLKDPCHSLNLVLSKSFEKLPIELPKFVDNIHTHFNSPQRVAFLNEVQKEKNLKVIGLRHYVKTRWLSLGQSLERLLLIWESLIEYMKREPKFTGLKKAKFKEFLSLLENENFKMKVTVWSKLITKMNAVNIAFQNQSLEIQQLKSQIYQCIRDIGNLFIHPNHFPSNLLDLQEEDWRNFDEAKEKFISSKDFISVLITDLDPKISPLESYSEEAQNEFTEVFQKYLHEIFRLLFEYLPYKDQIVNVLDFVILSASLHELKQKILTFNNAFKILQPEQISSLFNEISRIISDDEFVWMKKTSKKSSLSLWDLIQGTCSENCKDMLSKLFRTAHSLPTSSAGVEQSFSWLKLIRNVLRSRLQEETTQALLLIAQAFHSEDFVVSDEMIIMYDEIKAALIDRKTPILYQKEKEKSINMEINETNIEPKKGKKREPLEPLEKTLKMTKTSDRDQNEEDFNWANIEEALQEEDEQEEREECDSINLQDLLDGQQLDIIEEEEN